MSHALASQSVTETPGIREDAAHISQPCFPIKRLSNGRALLNLACGTIMHQQWNNLDFSPYARFRQHRSLAKVLYRVGFLSQERYQRFQNVDPNIICWNLRKGIPFGDNTFDGLYQSHFLEHLERSAALEFMVECRRVLKPSGIVRVVVPDLRLAVSDYVKALLALECGDQSALPAHAQAIYNLFDQMVRTEISGTAEQQPWVQRFEKIIRGNADRAGELHRWMYDQYSLGQLLTRVGFRGARCETATSSRIPGWSEFRLDASQDGAPKKPGSLYMEALK